MKIYNKILILFLVLTFVACNKKDDNRNADISQKIRITSTTGMITDAINYIAGDKVEIIATICGPGIDPHSYIPTTQDIVNIQNSDLIIYNGLNLEAKMGEIFEKLDDKKAIALGKAIPVDSLINNSDKSNILDYDPHVWNNPMLWLYSLDMLIDVLSQKDPANAEHYKTKGEEYKNQVRDAYNYAFNKYSQIPLDQRVLISEHDAFSYFAKAYGFEVKSVLGMNTDTEAGVKTIQDLTDYIVSKKVKAVFAETIINHKGIQALVNSANKKNHNLIIADKPLFSDALSQKPPTNTYTGIIRYNADVIFEVLK